MQPKPGRRVRAVQIAPMHVSVHAEPGGVTYLRSVSELGPYPRRLTDRLEFWAQRAPDRTFLAERGDRGEWRHLTYADALRRTRNIAQGLIDRRLSTSDPIAIVSGNSIEHALLALAAMYCGVPYAPISPAYSQLSTRFESLDHIFRMLKPALVFAGDGAAFADALRATLRSSAELVTHQSTPEGMRATTFASLESESAGAAVDAAHVHVGPDTIAKILFTSGSTGRPKGVINTQRMLCANQEMIASALTFLRDAPPVLCDWLPWNHTFGGNHNFGIVLYNGGSLYIDEGRPTLNGFHATAHNLREIAPTAYFNVPRGYELLVEQLRDDAALRSRFFSNVQILFYAAAGLNQRVWDELQDQAVAACGEEILMITGLGATETSPAAMFTGGEGAAAGMIGVPLPGVEVKLAPVGSKTEARVRGPNVTPGFWSDDVLTARSFDEEGFYRLGDAVRWIDPNDPGLGLMFDGRLNEDFKLSTGTWISVGPLRSKFLLHFAPLVTDVVIAAPDRPYVAALAFPNPRTMQGDMAASLQTLLDDFALQNPGSSTRIERLMVLEQPPSFDAREVTDKGSINQKAVLQNRAADVERLYHPTLSAGVFAVRRSG
jgi:feruloyl-CoA synthase